MTDSYSENSQIAEQLKRQMQQSGLTASELSAQTGIAMATLSRILSGKVNPTFQNIAKLANTLSISLDTLTSSTGIAEVANQSAEGSTSGKLALDVAGPESILVRYELKDTDHTAKAAGQLLETALCGSWAPSWTDPFVSTEQPQAKAVRARQIGNRRMEVEMVIPNNWVESGSIAGLLSVLGAALTGTNAQLKDVALPPSLVSPFTGPSFGVQGIREIFGKFGRPLLATTIRPMQGLSPKMYGRAVHEALRGGVDITCDPTLLHNTPTNPWRARFRLVAEAVREAMQDAGEHKFHAVNVTAGTIDEMIERADYARDLDYHAVLVDSAAIGWLALQNLAKWCQRNDVILCAMGGRTLAGGLLPEPLTAKLLRLAGCDVVSTASPLRGGGRREVIGVVNQLQDSVAHTNDDSGVNYDQNFLSRAASFPACGGGHNPWHFPRLIDALGNDIIIQCGGSVMGHPWGSAAGATAARVAVEAVVKAQAQSSSIAVDSKEILHEAQKHCPELRVALDHWQEGAFLFGVVLGGDAATGAKVQPFPTRKKPEVEDE